MRTLTETKAPPSFNSQRLINSQFQYTHVQLHIYTYYIYMYITAPNKSKFTFHLVVIGNTAKTKCSALNVARCTYYAAWWHIARFEQQLPYTCHYGLLQLVIESLALFLWPQDAFFHFHLPLQQI